MPAKRSLSQRTEAERRKRSRDKPSSDEEEDDEPLNSQFIKHNEDVIKDCLVSLLAHNSSLLPVKKNEIFSKFGDKVGRKDRNAIINSIKSKLQTIGACLKAVDGNRFIIVNQVRRNPLIEDEFTPERQLLCLILCLIAVNKGTIKKNELENSLDKLGIHFQTPDPYFGNVVKSIQLFERQCYLKKSTLHEKDKSSIVYEWGIRASCEVEKDDIINCITSQFQMSADNGLVSQVNLSMITPPEDDVEDDDEN